MFAHTKTAIVEITKPNDKPKLRDQAKTFSPKEIGLNLGLSRSAGNFFTRLSTSPHQVSGSLSGEAEAEKSKSSESHDDLRHSNDLTSKSSAEDEIKLSSSSDEDVFGFRVGK